MEVMKSDVVSNGGGVIGHKSDGICERLEIREKMENEVTYNGTENHTSAV